MPALRAIATLSLLLSLAACGTPNGDADSRVVDGRFVVSRYALLEKPASVRLGGKTFQLQADAVTWDRGSQKLQGNWGLLELNESPKSVDILLDGVVLTTIAK
jgi:hypothetical protein